MTAEVASDVFPWAAGTLRATAALTAREAAAGLAELRAGLRAPRLNPLNYRFELQGLGSNLGNVKVRFAGAAMEEGVAAAEHLQPPDLAMPPLPDKALSHIYYGDVDKGLSTGWHYEPTGDAALGTYVIESTRTIPDPHGVYKANVFIKGIKKKALSSFFPRSWTHEEVENAIEQAYRTRQPERLPGQFTGYSESGIQIRLDIDKKGRIVNAYPVYQEGC